MTAPGRPDVEHDAEKTDAVPGAAVTTHPQEGSAGQDEPGVQEPQPTVAVTVTTGSPGGPDATPLAAATITPTAPEAEPLAAATVTPSAAETAPLAASTLTPSAAEVPADEPVGPEPDELTALASDGVPADGDGDGDAPTPGSADTPSAWWRAPRLLALVAVVVVAAVAAGVLFVRGRGLPDDAAFAYGDQVVTKQDLQHHIELLQALYGLVPPGPGDAAADRFRRDAAKSLAVAELVEKEAAKRKIVVADRLVDDTLSRFVERQYPAGRPAFLAALGEQGVTEDAVRREVARQIQVQRLYSDVTKGVSVSPAQARAEYDRDPTVWALPALRDLREIVVRTRPEAQALLTRLRAGGDFPAAARTQSLDSSTSASAGSLGKVAKSQLDDAFGPAAFGAPVGGFFGPVPSAQGYFYVGQVVSQDPPRQRSLADVQTTVRQQLVTSQELVLWRAFLRKAIVSADIEYAPRFRPADPDAAPSDVLPTAGPAAATPAAGAVPPVGQAPGAAAPSPAAS